MNNDQAATIVDAMDEIHSGSLALPGIQRDFVWEPPRIYALLDSILRGYPFGTLLFWNTKQRVQYRQFARDWTDAFRPSFQVKPEGEKTTLVLDGQQRLQSLYLALRGTHEQRVLHFDLLSGDDPEDVSEAKYHFEFLGGSEADLRNAAERGHQLWVPLRNVAELDRGDLTYAAAKYQEQAGVTPDSEAGHRLSHNLSEAFLILTSDKRLNYFTIDPKYGDNGHATNLDEVLEIFVRVNSGGEVLTKSDLMFSLMQLQWEDAADEIADLCTDLNGKGRFAFGKDFVLKCALVCTGQGARYEVAKLRREGVLDGIRDAFPRLRRALTNCVDWLVETARFRDGRILGSYNTLIPFVYYLYLQQGEPFKQERTRLQMNEALYLCLMTRALSRFADSRIDRVVRDILDPAHRDEPGVFPLERLRRFVYDVEGVQRFDDALLQRNLPFVMNILEQGSTLPDNPRRHRPEYDHIFPQSRLRERGIPEDEINHYANFRLISKSENIWKSNADPGAYFGSQPEAAGRYLIPMQYLTYEQYPQFIEARRALIWERINHFLGLVPADGSDHGAGDDGDSAGGDGLGTTGHAQATIEEPQNGQDRPPAPPVVASNGKHTVEAVCRRADANGVGEPFRRLLAGAVRLGLHPRPRQNAITYAPGYDGRLFLFNMGVWLQRPGCLKGWISPVYWEAYLGVPQQVVAELLGPRGVLWLPWDEVDDFLVRLGQALQYSKREHSR